MKELSSSVKNVTEIADNVYSLTITLPEDIGDIKGGQFLNISTGDDSCLLKRPFGIVKKEGRDVTFCFQVKGDGTLALSRAKVGDVLSVLLPLGNGFTISKTAKTVAVIGGGVGVFPLVPVVTGNKDIDFKSYLGFRNAACACFLDDFRRGGELTVVTDDGSLGDRSNAVVAFMKDREKINADEIITCGPPIMLRVLKARLKEVGDNTPCFVSLEERMGCGVGACLVCVCDKENGEKARVCKDGPVFDINEVKL